MLNEKSGNEDGQRVIQEVIANFLESKSQSVIEKYIKEFETKKEFFERQKYILTEKSKERIALLIHYILNGIPVILEGNTGTFKTRTVITACNYINEFITKAKGETRELIRYNLSADSKIDDILTKYVSDNEKSPIGLKVQDGPFIDAYVNGKTILFDELNLAESNVLQCIQQPLDNGYISVETNGNCLLKKPKHKNFAIVGTQNPNKGAFIGKRQELGSEFLSRFQKIVFPDITEEEMITIAKGIAKNGGYLRKKKKGNDEEEEGNEDVKGYKNKKKLIENIVKFHFKWASRMKNEKNESQDDIQCFTIREIESVIDCLCNNGYPIYNIMMTIYGGRFRKETKQKLKEELSKYDIKKKSDNDSLPKNFPDCFKNDSVIQTVNMVILALQNKRNVIIVGNEESGLTYIAELCSRYFNKINGKSDQSFICFCTKNLECSDLIGTQKIADPSENKVGLLTFQPRFLYKAIKNGFCIVLDSINEAPSRVIERLNGLLDKKIIKDEEKFEVPEDSIKSEIKIHKDFRIICTTNFKQINQISPAFLNRFEVIVLENQLKELNDEEMGKLVEYSCNKYQKECYENFKNNKDKKGNELNEGKKRNNPLLFSMQNSKKNLEEKIEFTEELKTLFLKKLEILKNGKNPNESFDDL